MNGYDCGDVDATVGVAEGLHHRPTAVVAMPPVLKPGCSSHQSSDIETVSRCAIAHRNSSSDSDSDCEGGACGDWVDSPRNCSSVVDERNARASGNATLALQRSVESVSVVSRGGGLEARTATRPSVRVTFQRLSLPQRVEATAAEVDHATASTPPAPRSTCSTEAAVATPLSAVSVTRAALQRPERRCCGAGANLVARAPLTDVSNLSRCRHTGEELRGVVFDDDKRDGPGVTLTRRQTPTIAQSVVRRCDSNPTYPGTARTAGYGCRVPPSAACCCCCCSSPPSPTPPSAVAR